MFAMRVHSLNGVDVTARQLNSENNEFTSGVGDGLEELAGATGGAYLQLSASAAKPFERVNSETSGYYLLSFEPERTERDGKTHKIALSTTRSGVTIRARPEFLIPLAGISAQGPTKTQPRTLLKDLGTYRDLPLRTVAYTFRAIAGKQTVIVATDTTPDTRIAAASYALIDGQGKVVSAWDADIKDLARNPVVSATTVVPGAYRVRVAAQSADGRMGAVDYEYRVALAKAGPVTVGDLMLGQIRDTRFSPQLDFTAEPTVTAYHEVYGRDLRDQQATVTFEISETADGPVLVSAPAAFTSTADADRWIMTAGLPIARLAPGDYVVRAVTRVGTASATVVRTLRKSSR